MGNPRYSNEDIISRFVGIHGDKYDYSLVIYTRAHDKVKILCPNHGMFEQTPNNHEVKKQGCPICGGTKKLNYHTFISKAKAIHSNKYDYSLVDYIDTHTKIKIICPNHGMFEQVPYSHLQGIGCRFCYDDSTSKRMLSDTETFISKAKAIHSNKYDYSLVDYVHNKNKVKIVCGNHGVFEQTPNHHLSGGGCPECYKSTSQQEISFAGFIKSIYNGMIITNTKRVIYPYEIDVYLPNLGLAFEYNGNYWHEEGVRKPIGYHQMKTDMCSDKNILLTHVWENDWINNSEYIKGCIKRQICQSL